MFDTWNNFVFSSVITKRCDVNNGDCMHFCESMGTFGAKCSCARGYKLMQDGVNCEPRGIDVFLMNPQLNIMTITPNPTMWLLFSHINSWISMWQNRPDSSIHKCSIHKISARPWERKPAECHLIDQHRHYHILSFNTSQYHGVFPSHKWLCRKSFPKEIAPVGVQCHWGPHQEAA